MIRRPFDVTSGCGRRRHAGRQHVAFDHLADDEDQRHQPDRGPVAPELEQRQANGQRPADQRAKIGDEGHETGNEANDKAELQPDDHQRHGVIGAQHQAHGAHSADEG